MINLDQLMAAMRANQVQSQPTFPPVVGRAPPQQPFPQQVPTPGVPPLPGMPTMGNHMMQFGVSGPYGAQALQLAGLLGNQAPMPQQHFPVGFSPGRFMPGFRPGIDQPIRGSMPQGRRPVRAV